MATAKTRSTRANGAVYGVHDGVDYDVIDAPDDVPATTATTKEVGPGHDDDFVFDSQYGQIRIRSMAKGKNPPPFAMMKAEAEKAYSRMTLLVLRSKAGDDWPHIEAILEQLDEDEFRAFSEGWAAHSGVTVGE